MNQKESPNKTHTEEEEPAPRGAIAFVAIMLGSYAVYWAILWFVSIIQRGVGG
jgi:hypothetical protein